MAHTPSEAWCEACVRGRGRNADHKRLASEQDHEIDAVSVDDAFFGAHGQTTKLVLMAREHMRKWTEALLVQSRGGQEVWVEKFCQFESPRSWT